MTLLFLAGGLGLEGPRDGWGMWEPGSWGTRDSDVYTGETGLVRVDIGKIW